MEESMKRALIAATAALACATVAHAQERQRFTVAPFSDGSLRQLVADGSGRFCGNYFFEELTAGASESLIVFQSGEREAPGVVIIPRSRLVLVLDRHHQIPVAALRIDGDDISNYRWVIRTTPEKAREARPCLPKPSQDPDSF
jgi:hypothetical protein